VILLNPGVGLAVLAERSRQLRRHGSTNKTCRNIRGAPYLPGQLEARIEAFVAHYNHLRYHESIDNLTPADVYFGRGQTILLDRERIKRKPSNTDACITKLHAA
jgi:hypothetical protein